MPHLLIIQKEKNCDFLLNKIEVENLQTAKKHIEQNNYPGPVAYKYVTNNGKGVENSINLIKK